MATISSSDVKETILPEITFGTLPATGVRYELPRKSGTSLLAKDYGAVSSDTIKPGRNANGARRGNQSVSGTFELNAITAPVIDLLMESAVSGKFATNVLKAADTDVSFSHIAQVATGEFEVNTGCMVTGFTLSASAAEAVTLSFDIMGAKQELKSTIAGTFTATAVDNAAYEYLGHELLNVTVAGSTALKYTNLELSVTQARNARNVLSSNSPIGFAASGAREVTLTLTIYRETGVDYDALFTGAKQKFTFDLGIASYGRKFTVNGHATSVVTETEDDLMKTVTITGAYDNTDATALIIEKLV